MSVSATHDSTPEKQVILDKGQVAPFSGVLEPDYIFYQKEVDVAEKSDFQKELQICKQNQEHIQGVADSQTALWFASGSALTAILIFALRK